MAASIAEVTPRKVAQAETLCGRELSGDNGIVKRRYTVVIVMKKLEMKC